MAEPVELSSFAGGSEVGGGGAIERVNPAHLDEVVGRVMAVDSAAAVGAVDAAHAAFGPWSRLEPEERAALLLDAASDVLDGADRLAPLLARELGKVLADCRGEMGFAAAFLRYAVDAVDRVAVPTDIDDDAGRIRVIRRPYGVCVAIVPWNAPLILSILKVAPALATGNTIVVKPSPIAPLAVTGALSLIAAGLPPGVLSVVHGDAAVGSALVGHPLVRKVAFTGGGTVARIVAATAAEQTTPVVLELGGNDPAIVLDDADLSDEVMERLVWGTFLTSGQVCMAAKRLYVHESRANEFVDAYRAAAERVLLMGDPLHEAVTVGPMASAQQRDFVRDLIATSRSSGATVHDLGAVATDIDLDNGWFQRPTLVTGLDDGAPLVEQEQFGPTVPMLTFEAVDEVLDRANASELGLAGSVWSSDEDRAFAVAERLEAGFTFVNCHNRAGMSLRSPFGGWKGSGYGREFGDAGVAEYLQSHAIHVPTAMRLGDRAPAESTAANAYPT